MRTLGLILFGLLQIQLCNSQTLKKIDWSSDIDYLAKELPERHFDPFRVKDKKNYLSDLNKIKSKENELTDFEIALKLQQIIAGLGDSHTKINYEQLVDKAQLLPLNVYWFSDGLFILQTTHENSELLGHQILSVNGIPLKTITDSLSTLITTDNEAILKRDLPKLLPLVQVLEHFGFIKEQEIELELKDLTDKTKKRIIKPAEMNRTNRVMFKPHSQALCYKNERAFFVEYYQAIDKIYYLQYNKCWSKEIELQYGNSRNAEKLPSFKEFDDKVFQTLKTTPVDKIVFDIRFNGGGNSVQGTEFTEKMAKYLKENPNKKIYVILGRETFSSAILNAMDFKRLTNAVFVGEETSGKPNHFGEVRNFQLPSSGIRVNYSTKYFKRSDETVNTLTPDIKPESGFSDFSHGIDPAYEWIRKQ
jgi:hypothetical protein